MNKVYFQIGTNEGNDLFRDMVKDDKPDLVILVEPNKSLVDNIKKNLEMENASPAEVFGEIRKKKDIF